MPIEEIELIIPGKVLRDELSKIIPFYPDENSAFVTRFDKTLKANGNLARLMYDSALNYFLRRLITTAEYIKRKHYDTTGDQLNYWRQLRSFLREQTEIPTSKQELIFTLLLRCVEERNRTPSPGDRNRVLREARRRNFNCYICGRPVVYGLVHDDPHDQNAEVEHVWPKALGGANKETNLRISCKRCNKVKADFIDSSDFHYEEICIVTDESMDHFRNDFTWEYRVAVLAKREFMCSMDGCTRSARLYGELKIQRIDPSDSWHYLNIMAFCSSHASRR